MREPIITGKQLGLGYTRGKEQKEVFSNLSFNLFVGELTCLLGPNGVGKSTLIRAIIGRLKPWRGQVLLKGKEVTCFSDQERARELAVVLTEPSLPGNMTVAQLVSLGRTPYTNWAGTLSIADREIVENALSVTNTQYIRDQRLGEISDGQRQKALIARALAQDSEVLILDEPTAHLDLANRYEVMQLLREIAHQQDKAILVVTHDLEIALESADRFWMLNCGEPIVSGRPEDLIVSGRIDQLLPGDKFHFSIKRGKIEFEIPEFRFEIDGPRELVFWLEKALIKAGIKKLDASIRIDREPFSISLEGKKFDSIEGLITSLKG